MVFFLPPHATAVKSAPVALFKVHCFCLYLICDAAFWARKERRTGTMEKSVRNFVERLERIRREGHSCGWGVGDEMNDLMAKYGLAGK